MSEDTRREGKAEPENEIDEGLLAKFKLETSFSDLGTIFSPSRVTKLNSKDVVFAVDTNVLLLPYTIRKDSLAEVQKFFDNIRSEDRLFLPARVAREFIVNRDKKLADLIKMMGDLRSKINIGEKSISPILESVEGSTELADASAKLTDARKAYLSALSKIEREIETWSGDDPVTKVYDSVFDKENIVSADESQEELAREWKVRRENRIPPGHKDSNKADTGIGDFLIWKSILKIGKMQNRDLVFITGDEKGDWFVRSDGNGVYPRPELIAEYRSISGGKSIRLAEFHEILREMQASDELVDEVEVAETTQKNAKDNFVRQMNDVKYGQNTSSSTVFGYVNYSDFRMPYGGSHVVFAAETTQFRVHLSERSEDTVWTYPSPSFQLQRIEISRIGTTIDRTFNTGVSAPIDIAKGQMIYARDNSGNTLVARLVRATPPNRDQFFEAGFSYAIYRPGSPVFVP